MVYRIGTGPTQRDRKTFCRVDVARYAGAQRWAAMLAGGGALAADDAAEVEFSMDDDRCLRKGHVYVTEGTFDSASDI